jgi:hypothetical protein
MIFVRLAEGPLPQDTCTRNQEIYPMKKFLAVLTTAALATGLALIAVAAPASAHNNTVNPTCSNLSVDITNYATKSTNDKSNTLKVVIDGTTEVNTTFGASYSQTFTYSSTAVHSWSVTVVAYDNSQYNVNESGTTTPCTTTVTPVTPTVHAVAACGTAGSIALPTTTGVDYSFVTGSARMTEGPWEVHATPQTGFVFPSGATTTFTGNLGTKTTCTTITTAPTATDITCVQNPDDTVSKPGGYITVAAVSGVTYAITGGTLATPITTTSGNTTVAPGTYTVTATGADLTGTTSWTLKVVDNSGLCVPTLAFTSGTVGSGDQVCTGGTLVSGYITTDQSADTIATLTYTLNGTVLGTKTTEAPGTYVVTMTPKPGFSIDKSSATVTVHANTAPCAQLTSLAFTGGSLIGFGYLSVAALFLMAGGVFLARARARKNAAR